MRHRITIFLLATVLLVSLAACGEDSPEPTASAPPDAVPISATITFGESAYLGDIEFAANLNDAFIAGETLNADLSGLEPCSALIQYDSAEAVDLKFWPDPLASAVYYIWGGNSYKMKSEHASWLLSQDLFASLYIDPLKHLPQVVYGDTQFPLPITSYSFTYQCPEGERELAETDLTNTLPTVDVFLTEDISYHFDLPPDKYEVHYIDENGVSIVPNQTGSYICVLKAEYTEAETGRYQGSISYSFVLKVTFLDMDLSSDQLQQGGLVGVTVSGGNNPEYVRLTAGHTGQAISLFAVQDHLVALLPATAAASTGSYDLNLFRRSAGDEWVLLSTARYEVTRRSFDRQDLTVSSELAAMRLDDSNARYDAERTSAARAESSPTALWSGSFLRPVSGRISTTFGQERYTNGTFTSRHSGIDIAAAAGTPVAAGASGRVVMVEELIISGNTVMIDHGMGLFTSYCHLSEMSVRVGDIVEAGGTVGLVGSTGFSTGPHLHYSAVVGTTYIDPLILETDDFSHIFTLEDSDSPAQ